MSSAATIRTSAARCGTSATVWRAARGRRSPATYEAADLSFDLFGALLSAPRIDAASPNPATRSGLVHIMGAHFGASKETGQLTIDGKASPFIGYWSDNLIIAHVPETATLGNVTVSVTAPGGTGTGAVNVAARQQSERVRWRGEAFGDYILGRPAVAPPGAVGAGAVYAATNAGYLYAWTPDGALKWVAPGASGDDPVSVGADGTIYAASAGYDAQGRYGPAVAAFNPDGTRNGRSLIPTRRACGPARTSAPTARFTSSSARSLTGRAIAPA